MTSFSQLLRAVDRSERVDPLRLAGAAYPATLDSLPDVGAVHRCEYLTRTARLPPGKTLVLSMTNLDGDASARFFAAVFDWQNQDRRTTWRGALYFGRADSSIGQRYHIELLVADRAADQRAIQVVKTTGRPWTASTLPAWATPAATIAVRRIAGPHPSTPVCEP